MIKAFDKLTYIERFVINKLELDNKSNLFKIN